MRPLRPYLLIAVLASLPLEALEATQADSAPAAPQRPLLAVGEALLVNVLVNRTDAWVLGAEWAQSGTRTWSRNIRLGWEWRLQRTQRRYAEA